MNHDERVDDNAKQQALGYEHPIMDSIPKYPNPDERFPFGMGKTIHSVGEGVPPLSPAPPVRICEILKIGAYDATVCLVCGDREYINFLMERTPHWTPFGEEDEQGMVFWPDSKEFYVLLDYSKVNLRLILHEGYHLTNAILDEKGAFYGAENDEHGALLHEYVTEWIYKTLKERNVL